MKQQGQLFKWMLGGVACISLLVGGSAGTLLGLAISVVFAQISGWAPTLSYLAAALGFGMSLATGLFFGIYPARKASELSPIEALKSE